MRTTATTALVLLGLASTALAQPKPTDWAAYYHQHVAAHQAENATLDASKRYVILLGDSLTEGWSKKRVQAYLPTLAPRVLNRGISSDGVGINSRGVLHRLDSSVFDCHPSHIVLHIGVNDIEPDGSGIDRTVAKLREVIAAIRARLPDTPLLLLRVAPGRGKYASWNPALKRYNERVGALVTELGLPALDLFALFAGPDGLLPDELSVDGLHWKDPAYERLGRELEAWVGAPVGASVGGQPVAPTTTPPATSGASFQVETQASTLNVRDAPMGTKLGTVPRGTRLEALELKDGWYRVRWNDRDAWISAVYAKRVEGLSGAVPGQ